jgi:hypothetical protein
MMEQDGGRLELFIFIYLLVNRVNSANMANRTETQINIHTYTSEFQKAFLDTILNKHMEDGNFKQ